MYKRRRKTLTLKDKTKILNMIDSGDHFNSIAEHFGIGRTTVHDIKARRSKILAASYMSDDRKTLRQGKYPELESDLYKWFLEERAKGNPVNGDIIREKSKEIYFETHGQPFKASPGWLEKFKKRFGIRFFSSAESGEPPSFRTHHENVIANFLEKCKEKLAQLDLVPDQLYSVDASALYWKILTKKDDVKERIIFMPCCNATATHKFNLFVVGKGILDDQDLISSVCYKQGTRDWMNSELFSDWFHEEFVPEVRQFMSANKLSDKALLILDDAPGYPEEYSLKSNDWMIQAMFLPAEFSQTIQPVNEHLINTLKSDYRKKIISNLISKGGDLKQNLKDLTLNTVVKALAEAWSSISSNVIKESWKQLCPELEIDAEEKVDDGHLEYLPETLKAGVIEKDIRNWVEGKIREIIDVTVSPEVTMAEIKVEDPLIVEKEVEDEDELVNFN